MREGCTAHDPRGTAGVEHMPTQSTTSAACCTLITIDGSVVLTGGQGFECPCAPLGSMQVTCCSTHSMLLSEAIPGAFCMRTESYILMSYPSLPSSDKVTIDNTNTLQLRGPFHCNLVSAVKHEECSWKSTGENCIDFRIFILK